MRKESKIGSIAILVIVLASVVPVVGAQTSVDVFIRDPYNSGNGALGQRSQFTKLSSDKAKSRRPHSKVNLRI